MFYGINQGGHKLGRYESRKKKSSVIRFSVLFSSIEIDDIIWLLQICFFLKFFFWFFVELIYFKRVFR